MSQDNSDQSVDTDDDQATYEIAQGVTGQIKANGSNPVVGAMIVPKSLHTNSPAIPEIAIVSGADGIYQWPLPPGPYEITVIAEGYQNATQRVTFDANEVVTLDFLLHLNP